jgi:hypothetical protein
MERELAKTLKWRLRHPTYSFWLDSLIDLWIDYRKSLHISDLDFNEE